MKTCYLSPIIVETKEAALSMDLNDGVGEEDPILKK